MIAREADEEALATNYVKLWLDDEITVVRNPTLRDFRVALVLKPL
jgi:hypothetical protein